MCRNLFFLFELFGVQNPCSRRCGLDGLLACPILTRTSSVIGFGRGRLVVSSGLVAFSHCHLARQESAVRCILCPIVFQEGVVADLGRDL